MQYEKKHKTWNSSDSFPSQPPDKHHSSDIGTTDNTVTELENNGFLWCQCVCVCA